MITYQWKEAHPTDLVRPTQPLANFEVKMTWCERTPIISVFGPRRKKIPKTVPSTAGYVFWRHVLRILGGNIVLILPICHPEYNIGFLPWLNIRNHLDCFSLSLTLKKNIVVIVPHGLIMSHLGASNALIGSYNGLVIRSFVVSSAVVVSFGLFTDL